MAQYQKYKTKAVAQMADVPHLTDEQRNTINEKCAVAEQHFMEVRSKLETSPKHEDPPTTLNDIDRKLIALEAEVNAILNAPPPKKEEEKKDDAPAADDAAAAAGEKPAEGEAADVDMKEEGKEAPAEEPAAAATEEK